MTVLQYSGAREAVRDSGLEMLRRGLTHGTGGNVSCRATPERVAISPTAIPYDEVATEDVPIVNLDGEQVHGSRAPSVEAPMHLAVYRDRPEVEAVVHTHSPFATVFASLDTPIEPYHYLIANVGERVPVAEYATFGTQDLGRAVVDALGAGTKSCLLENHGVLAVGEDLQDALDNAMIVEFCARIQCQSQLLGEPEPIPTEELATLAAKFESYGQD